jgi:hypothetical protein
MFANRIDFDLLAQAVRATAEKRGSLAAINNYESVLSLIESDETMRSRWNGYSKAYSYSSGIDFSETVAAVRNQMNRVSRTI